MAPQAPEHLQLPSDAQQACEGAAKDITLKELHLTLKQSARAKKPGLYGLPYGLYPHFWGSLGPELLAVHQQPTLPATVTKGVTTLLYKGKSARALLDSYRQLTLLKSHHKLLAKAFTTEGTLNKHLFYNLQIITPSVPPALSPNSSGGADSSTKPLMVQDQPHLVSAAVTQVAH